MARLILHSRYFKPGAPGRVNQIEYLINYIGTREGVEKLGEHWKKDPETKSQKEMIEKLLKDVPEIRDTHEWEDYAANPTKGNASEVISMGTEMVMTETGKVQNYVDYIANRPRVEKEGKEHGLFMQTDGNIDLAATAKMVSEHPGNVWTNVISLRREDAERLCYAHADAWRTLVRAHMAELAAAWKIPPQDFQWYAAFHNESHHPHIHMVCYSIGREGYLTQKGIEQAKSSLAKDIFAQDLSNTYVRQTKLRQELKEAADRYLHLAKELPGEAGDLSSEMEPLIAEIRRRLPDHGRMQYAYMPTEVKNLIDAAVDVLERNRKIAELYQLWYEQKCAVLATYRSTFPEKEPLRDNETFRSIKNEILKMAEKYQSQPFAPSQVGAVNDRLDEGDAEPVDGDKKPLRRSRAIASEDRAKQTLEAMLERLGQAHGEAEESSPAERADAPEPESKPTTTHWETLGEAWEREEAPPKTTRRKAEQRAQNRPKNQFHDFEQREYTSEQWVAIERRMRGMERPGDAELIAGGERSEERFEKDTDKQWDRERKVNQFHDFDQRNYDQEDWDAIEKVMLFRDNVERHEEAEAALEALAERKPGTRRRSGQEGDLPSLWSDEFKAARSAYRETDFSTAYQGFLSEHRLGNPLATMWLAQMTERGLGVERSESGAEALYDAASKGFLHVYEMCGALCEKTGLLEKEKKFAAYLANYLPFRIGKLHGRKEEYAEAAEWYQKSSTPYAMFGLGGLYERGQGVDRDPAKAFALYKAAADESIKKIRQQKRGTESETENTKEQQSGFPFAEYKVATMSSDPAEQEEYYQRAFAGFTELSQQKDADDLIFYRLGEMLRCGNGCEANLPAAVEMYEKAVEMHNKNAAYRLGMVCLDQDGGFFDPGRGLELLQIAAEDNEWGKPNPYAQYYLAKLYLSGEYVPEDRAAGMDYLRKAAEQGYATAEYRLGVELLYAEGAVSEQIAEGLMWLQKAAEQKNGYAMYLLAKTYIQGRLVPRDITLGMAYLQSAADEGMELATERLQRGVEDWLHDYAYQPPVLPGCVRMLGQLGRLFETQHPQHPLGGMDKKLRREMQQKKEAMGLRM